ncbi:methyltransferase [Labrys miyagiensis]|uniref:Methyltransferase n=1 Tax=Labrys miyagiensis TaxID=346912 RepID=A0ABQ6CPC8_9HYPH|nr:SAM-dependent methyltransferase [Labrys miyagiensis]GLS20564.1 methyltransferase [Labrys miyagiensis]
MTKQSLGIDYFETLYRANPDPWNFATSDYEHRKYQATLDALQRPLYANALEVGCSIGVLTARLATRCKTLNAIDLSPSAIAKAMTTCSAVRNIRFSVGGAPNNLPLGPFDLIVLSEVLYYLDKEDLLSLATWCCHSTASEADIVLCHWLGPTDYPLSGDYASKLFVKAMQPCLESHAILHEEVYRLERIRLCAKEL